MDKITDGNFFSPSKGNLKFNQVIEEIFSYIAEQPEKFYELIVGCDSSSLEEPHFPLAIVIWRKGGGGRFFLKNVFFEGRKFFSWKQRILQETLLSCELALNLKEVLDARIGRDQANGLKYEFKYIHADVGENGLTRDMIKEVVGLIHGNGFEAKIKPDSFAASNIADRYSK